MAFPKSRILTSSDLCEIVSNGKKTRRFCFIFGSGASVESGIPTGNTLEMRWMDCLMGLSGDGDIKAMDPERTRHFAESLHAEKKLQHTFQQIREEWETAKKEKRPMSSEYYFDIYRLRFHLDPQSGYRYLERVMDPCEPSLGYHSLALILTNGNRHPSRTEENLHNLVITTNFDSLVEDALSLYTDQRPLVANHESLAAFIHPDIRRPIVAKVHRGLMYDPFNNPQNTSKLKKEWSKILEYALNAYTPIVVGYGGGDGSLMSALQKAEFRNGIYWCFRKVSGLPDPKIQDFLEKQEGYLVETEGFDALMMELGITLFDQMISPDETRSHFKTQSDRRMGVYTNQWNELKKIPQIAKILEPISKAEDEAQEQRAEAGTLTYWDHFDRAYDAAEKGDHDTAIREYSLAIAKDPNHPHAYNNRGLSYHNLKQYERAIQDCDKAIELDPNYAFAYNNRGLSYHDLKQYERAIQDYDKAIELDPNFALAYNNRGTSYHSQGKYEQAIKDYTKAIELAPNDVMAYHNRGNSHRLSGRYEQAIQDCTKAIELDPNCADAYRKRSYAYRDLGKNDLAEFDKAKAAELEAKQNKKDNP
ncbi:MAG: tetratricopeptide repeat protein [Oscillospiraceae bacterium]|nr:tetratricopeptide repeat protein [Oscillospiraceae bacterium]